MTPAYLISKTLGEPTLLPVWPKSEKIALVCVECTENNKTVAISVIRSAEHLESKLATDNEIRMLFFQLLKSDLVIHE